MRAEGMDRQDFADLVAGLRDVAAWRTGAREGFVAHVPETVDVRAISVRDWKQGPPSTRTRRAHPAPMIAKAPGTVKRVMEGM